MQLYGEEGSKAVFGTWHGSWHPSVQDASESNN